jgi:hypothetical protein
MRESGANDRAPTLPALLAHRARHASDGRLVLDAVGGLIVGALALATRPPGWPILASAAASFLAFGVWGISDRILEDAGVGAYAARALRALRGAAAAFGAASALALVLTAMALMLGTWIS